MEIREALSGDSENIRLIFNQEVEGARTVLELVPRSPKDQRLWFKQHSGIYSVLVASEGGEVLGYASLSPYRTRPGYNTTSESSVFVHQDHRQKGIGAALMEALLETAQANGFHTLIARVAEKNEVSVKLHMELGFELVGVEREVGRKFGKWVDCSVLQKML